MFQGHIQSFQIPYPYKGINTNADNDPSSARFIQNMITGDNKTGKLRYGTNLNSEFDFDINRTFRDPIAIMSFLKDDGVAEILVYTQYLTKILDLNIALNVVVTPNVANAAYSTLTIDISTYTADQKAYFKKVIFDGVYIFVKQNASQGEDILDFSIIGNIITFNLPFAPATFENPYELWVERGGIYRVKTDDTYELVEDDLDPNVIVSHINFQEKLLIANGVDPVKVYDGTDIVDLVCPVSAPTAGNITINVLNLQFNIAAVVLSELQDNIIVGTVLTLISDLATVSANVTAITFAAPVNGLIAVTITVDAAPPVNIRKIVYSKSPPAFSYLCVAHKRLWALPEGRSSRNTFRSPDLAMRVYYAAKIESYDGWFNESTNTIDFINTADTSGRPDNLEVIVQFEGRVLFIGRDTLQFWVGEDPTSLNDGQNLQLPDFKWYRTLEVGVIQKTLCVEVPNNLILGSKYGFVAINSLNISQQPEINYQFSDPINYHLNNQLAFIETDREYRSMRGFLYPYGRYIGFKIKYSCFIYQLITDGAWTVFSENFAEANSFFYDTTSQNLFLGGAGGNLLTYADKVTNQTYEEYGKGKMSWGVFYNWIYPGTSWVNTKLYVGSQTLKKMTITSRIFIDRDESKSIIDDIVLQQQGVLYDVSLFDNKLYSNNETNYSHESIRFTCDAIMIHLSGLANDSFVFDRLFLTGGTQDSTKGGN